MQMFAEYTAALFGEAAPSPSALQESTHTTLVSSWGGSAELPSLTSLLVSQLIIEIFWDNISVFEN